jgi:hypothetical protein
VFVNKLVNGQEGQVRLDTPILCHLRFPCPDRSVKESYDVQSTSIIASPPLKVAGCRPGRLIGDGSWPYCTKKTHAHGFAASRAYACSPQC